MTLKNLSVEVKTMWELGEFFQCAIINEKQSYTMM